MCGIGSVVYDLCCVLFVIGIFIRCVFSVFWM